MEREKKQILKYLEDGQYCILAPVYYECESKPTWRKCYVGSKEECENKFSDYLDYYMATNDENNEMRNCRFQEYLFLIEKGLRKKDALKIKEAYGF